MQQPQPPGAVAPVQAKASPPEPTPLQLKKQLPTSSVNERVNSTQTNHGHLYSRTDATSENTKQNRGELLDILCKIPPQEQPKKTEKEPAKSSLPTIRHCPNNANSEGEEALENWAAKNKELDDKVAKLLESRKLPGIKLPYKKKKDKGSSEKKKRKKIEKGGLNSKKKTPTTPQEGKTKRKREGHGNDGKKLSGLEQIVIDFLGSKGSKHDQMNTSKDNGTDQICTKRQCEVAEEVKKHIDGTALEILFDLKRTKVTEDEVQNIKKWSKENQTSAAVTSPSVFPKEPPFPSQGHNLDSCSLPNDPVVNDQAVTDRRLLTKNNPADMDSADTGREASVAAVPLESLELMDDCEADLFTSNKKRVLEHNKAGKRQDKWWPSNAAIRKERRKCGQDQDVEDSDVEAFTAADLMPGVSFVKAGVEAARKRLATSVEPGVLEKLPYCKLYDDYCREHKTRDFTPKFCCQTTETFPFEVMVCCSICSTWRHAQCGGHYKHYTPDSVDPSNVLFQAVCDQCFLEKQFLVDQDVAAARIERQRIEHIRRCNASNAVMRQFAFGKHSQQYKWPLGSVQISRIPRHIRSVQTRHEKVEKQWNEMTHRLTNRQELRPRERQRVRTREFEKLLLSIEDAGVFALCKATMVPNE